MSLYRVRSRLGCFPFVLLFLASIPLWAKVNVVTTTSDLQAITAEIGGDLVSITAIAAGNQDPHFVDAKPSYLVKLQRADLFVQVGMELEIGWVPNLLLNARNPKIQVGAPGYVDASFNVQRLQVPNEADRSAGDIHPYGNPHYWLDPHNGAIIADNICAGLVRVDPSHSADFQNRLADFKSRLNAAIEKWTTEAAVFSGSKIVAYHDSWPYFEHCFQIHAAYFIEPKPGIPPSGRYVAELIEKIKQDGIKVIITAPYYNPKSAQMLAEQTGAKLVVLANSVDGLPHVSTYFDLFDTNLKLLKEAFGH
ncbi:MAG: zinc ABC transporter substrate-binding protein [Acidobacteria bacterium]|nr:zinc ABC transporter substrate-binding protein [Acidobacteriota bacterium]MCB9397239.1 zinc ABC transporter substrate-binding protein [Acidobacteriota bacterium]